MGSSPAARGFPSGSRTSTGPDTSSGPFFKGRMRTSTICASRRVLPARHDAVNVAIRITSLPDRLVAVTLGLTGLQDPMARLIGLCLGIVFATWPSHGAQRIRGCFLPTRSQAGTRSRASRRSHPDRGRMSRAERIDTRGADQPPSLGSAHQRGHLRAALSRRRASWTLPTLRRRGGGTGSDYARHPVATSTRRRERRGRDSNPRYGVTRTHA